MREARYAEAKNYPRLMREARYAEAKTILG
jgi:hypothetical protein